MRLKDLTLNKTWASGTKTARDRFLKAKGKKDGSKFKADNFHGVGSDIEKNAERILELADQERVNNELNRYDCLIESAYATLVLRYSILSILITKRDYQLRRTELISEVQGWQTSLYKKNKQTGFEKDDLLLCLAQAASEYNEDIFPQELNLIRRTMDFHNQTANKANYLAHLCHKKNTIICYT